jgi:hypothetical protein
MTKKDEPGFWTKECDLTLPGEGTYNTYWTLKFLHPASASAMILGAAGLGYLGWRLFRDTNLWLALLLGATGLIVGAWVGLVLYWLLRFIGSFVN